MKQCSFLIIVFAFINIVNGQSPRISITNNIIKLNSKQIKYKAIVKEYFLPVNDKPVASVITTSYEMDPADTLTRAIVFLFNGGPGASSSPLHMHAFGPVRLMKGTDTTKQVNNPYSLLDVADLVFIDPIGTGFTKIFDEGKAESYMDIVTDAQSVIDIIKIWKEEHHRSSSPVFICGESYGTIRAVKMLALAEHFPVKGVLLFSAVLDFSLMAEVDGNEMPYLLNLPSMAAIAWYHKKIERNNRNAQQVFDEAIEFANTDYMTAVFQGHAIKAEDRIRIAGRLSKITGLTDSLILERNLRPTSADFETQLLADQHLRIGKLNGQIALPVPTEKKPYSSRDDPSLVVNTDLKKDFVGKYFMNSLKFPGEGLYRGINFDVNSHWKWNSMAADMGYYSVLPDLEKAMNDHPQLKLLIAGGMYDLATPLYATKYLINHSTIPGERITFLSYPAGHSIFDNEDQLPKLAEAVRTFILKQ